MYGDGVVIAIDNENQIECVEIRFKNNAPYYLSARVLYPEKYKESVEEPNMIICNHMNILPYDKKSEARSSYPLYFSHNINEYKCVMIATDGLCSFKNYSSSEDPTLTEVVTNLCDIKGFRGEFLQRRANRLLKDYAEKNIYHYDDLTIAGISIFNED